MQKDNIGSRKKQCGEGLNLMLAVRMDKRKPED